MQYDKQGFDSFNEYLRDDKFLGVTVGRYANRQSHGATHHQTPDSFCYPGILLFMVMCRPVICAIGLNICSSG